MQGKIEQAGKSYEWWAGKANPDAEGGDFCVHCRQGEYGVTRYFDREPDKAQAERAARELAPAVDKLH